MSNDRPAAIKKIERPMRGPMHHTRGYEKPKEVWRVIGRLGGYLQRYRLALLVVLGLVLVNSASSLAGNYFLKPLINDYILPGDFSGLGQALGLLAAIYLVGAVAAYGQSRLMVHVAQHTCNTLRRDLFVKLQSLPLTYFDAHTHGELMSRYTNDIDSVQLAFEMSLVQLISSSLTFLGALVMMLLLSPALMLVTLTVLSVMSVAISKVTGRSRTGFQGQQRSLGDLNGYVEELMDGLKVVKVFGHERQAIAAFEKRNEAYREAAVQANFYAGVSFPAVGNLTRISYAATAVVGGLLAVWGRFDIGSLAAYLQYTQQVGMPVQMITNQFNNLLAALAGAERVFEVMDQEPEVDGGAITLVGVTKKEDGGFEVNRDGAHPTHWAWQAPQPNGPPVYVQLKGDLRFHGVTFGYVPGEPVLHDVSLYAKPGQKIAFVGSTGAGKTTITYLMNRFYEVDHGQISFDGIDIKDIAYFMKDWKADYERHVSLGFSIGNIKGFSPQERPIYITHGYGHYLPIMAREVYVRDEKCFGVDPDGRAKRKKSDSKQDRWRKFSIAEVRERDFKLDGFKWLKDDSLEDADDLPEPEELATDAIAELEEAVGELNAVLAFLENSAVTETEAAREA